MAKNQKSYTPEFKQQHHLHPRAERRVDVSGIRNGFVQS